MAVALDPERPNMRLPFTRTERANGVLLWLFVSFPVFFVVFILSRFVPFLHDLFTVLTVAYGIAVVAVIAEYFLFEERITIDNGTVHYRRKSIFGVVEWSERLKNYTGVVVITANAGKATTTSSSALDSAPSRSHWSKRPVKKFVRMVGRDTTKSVTLWEFDDRDFPQAISKKAQTFAEILELPALPSQSS